MQRPSELVVMGCLTTAALFLGGALCFLSFSYLPLYWVAGLVVVFLICFVVREGLRHRVSAALYLVAGLAYSAVFACVVFTFIGVGRVEHYECDWRMEGGQLEINLQAVGGF